MKKNLIFLAMFLSLSFIISSCSTYRSRSTNYNHHTISGNLVVVGYTIADSLVANLKAPIEYDATILVSSFVNINNLEESSTFGRMLSEQVSSRFSQMGYKVKELKLRKKSIYMEKEKGEFLLSRDMQEVSNRYNAVAIVAGTYGKSANSVYVSAKIVNPNDNILFSSCDYNVPISWRTMARLMD